MLPEKESSTPVYLIIKHHYPGLLSLLPRYPTKRELFNSIETFLSTHVQNIHDYAFYTKTGARILSCPKNLESQLLDYIKPIITQLIQKSTESNTKTPTPQKISRLDVVRWDLALKYTHPGFSNPMIRDLKDKLQGTIHDFLKLVVPENASAYANYPDQKGPRIPKKYLNEFGFWIDRHLESIDENLSREKYHSISDSAEKVSLSFYFI